ncbi:MAG: hypothetical protein H0W81_03270 [Chloroflexi bacterium]|nr:hypothetical protein [Chloroflexota bacterium]
MGRLIFCTCRRYVKANGTDGSGQPQRVHPGSCAEWPRPTYPAATWLEPLAAQVQQIVLDDVTIATVVDALTTTAPRRDKLARKRLERRRREAAEAFAARRVTMSQFAAQIASLEEQQRTLEAVEPATEPSVPSAAAVAYLKDLPALWRAADEAARADLLAAIYPRVEVRGAEFIAVTLTPEAEAHGLALALPESVCVARPAGIEPAT